MKKLINIYEELSESINLFIGDIYYYLINKNSYFLLNKNDFTKISTNRFYALNQVGGYFIVKSPYNYWDLSEDERKEADQYLVRYDHLIKEIDRKKVEINEIFKTSGKAVLSSFKDINETQFTVGFDYSANEEVFCVKKLNWSMSNNLIELFGDYLFYLAEDGLHCQDTKIKKDLWVKPNEILEERCQHFKFLEYTGQMICYNMTDGFVSYNILTGNKNWTWAINPDIYYRYTLSKDGVLHIIADDWYIQLDANNGKEISRFCYWPTVMEMVNNPISKERAGMANPIATNSHLLYGSQGALFLINRETGNIDFLHELEITFRIFPTLNIDENKIIYTCTNNSWQDLKSKAVFLVFEEQFKF